MRVHFCLHIRIPPKRLFLTRKHTHADAKEQTDTRDERRLPPRFFPFLIPNARVELNRVLDVWVVFLCPKCLTNCCCPEQKQPLHCLSICAQPYQRFNTYCFKLHQSLPPLPSHSPSSLGSFFSVSFYYFASSSFSPLTSLHIILALVAFSSSSCSLSFLSYPLCPYLFHLYPCSDIRLFTSMLSSISFLLFLVFFFLFFLLFGTIFNPFLLFPLFLPFFEELG